MLGRSSPIHACHANRTKNENDEKKKKFSTKPDKHQLDQFKQVDIFSSFNEHSPISIALSKESSQQYFVFEEHRIKYNTIHMCTGCHGQKQHFYAACALWSQNTYLGTNSTWGRVSLTDIITASRCAGPITTSQIKKQTKTGNNFMERILLH